MCYVQSLLAEGWVLGLDGCEMVYSQRYPDSAVLRLEFSCMREFVWGAIATSSNTARNAGCSLPPQTLKYE